LRSTNEPGAPRRTAALALLLALLAAAPQVPAQDAAPPVEPAPAALRLSLEEAVARALERNDDVLIERRLLDSAEAAVLGARGAYDPVVGVSGGWQHTTTPVNSAFSGAPAGAAAPTLEGAEVAATVRRLLPTGGELLLRGAQGRFESDASFDLLSPAWDSQLGAELRQPLWRGREIDPARLGLRVAAADRDRSAALLRRQVIETVAEVERAYWTLLAVRREVAVREEAVDLAAEQLSETGVRIDNGVAPETEIAQPRAELERRRGELLASLEAVARAENDLKLLILSDDDGELWARPVAPSAADGQAGPVEAAPLDTAAALDAALALRAELEAAEALVARRDAESRFAADRVRPDLDLVVSYDRYGLAGSRNPDGGSLGGLPAGVPPGLAGGWDDSVSQLADGDFDDARVALVFEVPIGNRAARAAARIAENEAWRAGAELARARKAVRAEVLDAGAALTAAEGRIEAARAAREAAEVQLAAERERFAVGLSTNFLVLTRQNELASARLAEIEALTDYRTARTELGRATGWLLRERGIDVYER
jgi:outer membrane protein TolC